MTARALSALYPIRIFERCLAACAEVLGITTIRIVGQSRLAPVFRARAVLAWMLSRAFGWSLVQIGQYIGRHHTTVMDACERVDGEIATGGPLRDALVATLDQMTADAHARFGVLA